MCRNLLPIIELFVKFHSNFCLVKDKQTKKIMLRGRLEMDCTKWRPPLTQIQITPSLITSNLPLYLLFLPILLSTTSLVVFHSSKCESNKDVWHKRLVHPSIKVLSQVSKVKFLIWHFLQIKMIFVMLANWENLLKLSSLIYGVQH